MNEYKQKGTIHGIKLPPNLPESAKLAEPLFTPSTKADVGSKDENIHPDQGGLAEGLFIFVDLSQIIALHALI